jgi:hypothetical protein
MPVPEFAWIHVRLHNFQMNKPERIELRQLFAEDSLYP